METAVMHPRYLPFSEEQVLARFAAVGGSAGPNPNYLEHFRGQLEKVRALEALPRQRTGATPSPVDLDERFWTATSLLTVFSAQDPVGALAAVLARAYGDVPPFPGFASWSEALPDPQLFFEVALPSPSSYQHHLRRELRRHVVTFGQYQLGREKVKLEGATKADAVVVSPTTGVAVVVEAKVLADVSTHTTFDVVRNQLARVLDVTLDANPGLAEPALRTRRPDRTCVLLLTPEVFRDDPTSRLYGHLHTAYTTRPETLAKHLPHRPGPVVRGAAGRLGWLTWEDVEREVPGSLPWRAVPGGR